MGKRTNTKVLNLLRQKNKSLQRQISKLNKQLRKFRDQVHEQNEKIEKELQSKKPKRKLITCGGCGGNLVVIEIAGRMIEKCNKCGNWRKVNGREEGS